MLRKGRGNPLTARLDKGGVPLCQRDKSPHLRRLPAPVCEAPALGGVCSGRREVPYNPHSHPLPAWRIMAFEQSKHQLPSTSLGYLLPEGQPMPASGLSAVFPASPTFSPPARGTGSLRDAPLSPGLMIPELGHPGDV